MALKLNLDQIAAGLVYNADRFTTAFADKDYRSLDWSLMQLRSLVDQAQKLRLAATTVQAPSHSRNVVASRLPSTVMGELCERESKDFDR